MLAEGELRSNLDESDRVRDLQDKVADLKAEVRGRGYRDNNNHSLCFLLIISCTKRLKRQTQKHTKEHPCC